MLRSGKPQFSQRTQEEQKKTFSGKNETQTHDPNRTSRPADLNKIKKG